MLYDVLVFYETKTLCQINDHVKHTFIMLVGIFLLILWIPCQ